MVYVNCSHVLNCEEVYLMESVLFFFQIKGILMGSSCCCAFYNIFLYFCEKEFNKKIILTI